MFVLCYVLDVLIDGLQFDYLFVDGECFVFGDIVVEVIVVLGYISDSVVYCIGDVLFIGDLLFMFDGGMVCCDFLGGDVVQLYCFIQWLFVLFDVICVFICYDYGLGGCEVVNEIIIGDQCVCNIYLCDNVSLVEFVVI